MAQHDYVIANGTGGSVRSDLNGALAAAVSQNSGSTEPTTTYAYMPWADTTAGVMKMRNGANNGWITLFQLDGEWTSIAFENGTAAAPSIYFKDSGTDTGFYSPGTDQVAVSTGGTGRLFINSSGSVGIGTSAPGAALHVTAAGAGIQEVQWLRNGQSVAADVGSALVFTGTTSDNGLAKISGAFAGAATTDGGYMNFSTRAVTSGTLTERMRITAAGNVGIGTTSPSVPLHVEAASGEAFRASASGANQSIWSSYKGGSPNVADLRVGVDSAAGGTYGVGSGAVVWNAGNSPLAFGTNNTERARIDSSGRLLVGTSTANTSGNALLQVNGSIKGTVTSGTSVASTSGTSIDFTAIPSWVKRITVILNQVSTNGSSNLSLYLGDSGGVETTGYTSGFTNINPTTSISTSTNGFLIDGSVSTTTSLVGAAVLVNISGNTWIQTGVFNNAGASKISNGVKTLSDTLDRIRVTTGNGTDTFDAGAINILFEG